MKILIKNGENLRQAMREFCAFLEEQNVPPESIFDSRLVANELVGNVLRHASGVAELHGELKDGFIELKILTKNAYFPNDNPCAEVFSEHGRGLFLVRTVCKERIIVDDESLTARIEIIRK